MKFNVIKNSIPYFILAMFGMLLFTMAIANHYFFRTVTFDYGNYNFAFWDYSHFKLSPVPTSTGNYLQDHFSLTLMFFVPFFWLFNWLTGTYTLIIIQFILIMTAGWFTYKIIILKTGNIWLGSGVLIYYFVLYGRYTTFSCDCNLAVISSCFIPIFLYLFYSRKYITALIILIISILSRENIPIWFIFIFIVLIFEFRKDKKVVFYGLIGIFISVLYFILLFKVLIPSVESDDKQFTLFNYSALGESPGEALFFVVKHPFETFKLFFINHLNNPEYNGIKGEFYWVYILSGGFVLLIRPKYIIWFIPVVAQKVLNDSIIRWGISTYYSIEVVTLLPLSVFLTISTLKPNFLKYGLSIFICLITIAVTIYKLNPENVKLKWTTNPSKERIYDKNFFTEPFDIKKVNTLLSQIPEKARVSASDHILPHVSQRQYIYMFPEINDAEYIAISVYDDHYLLSQKENEDSRDKYLNDPDWKICAAEYPFFLLKNNNSLWQDSFEYDKKWISDTILCNFENVDKKEGQILFSDNTFAEKADNLSEEKYRSGKHSIMLNPQNPYAVTLNIPDINRYKRISLNAWYLSSEDKQSNLVASCDSTFYLNTNEIQQTDSSGWKKIELKFWVDKIKNESNFKVYLWFNGHQPAYFDDFMLIKHRLSETNNY